MGWSDYGSATTVTEVKRVLTHDWESIGTHDVLATYAYGSNIYFAVKHLETGQVFGIETMTIKDSHGSALLHKSISLEVWQGSDFQGVTKKFIAALSKSDDQAALNWVECATQHYKAMKVLKAKDTYRAEVELLYPLDIEYDNGIELGNKFQVVMSQRHGWLFAVGDSYGLPPKGWRKHIVKCTQVGV